MLANAFVHRGPAFVHPRFVFLGNEAERGVLEHDQCSTIDFTQPILHVANEREKSEQRASKLQQRGPLDGLDVGPEVPIAVAQVTIPPATGPCFDLHAERFSVRCFVAGPELLEQRGEGYIQRSLYVDFLIDR